MSTYGVAPLDEMEKRNTWRPVREHFGIGLGRSIELYPGFRDFAREDSDFDPARDEAPVKGLLEVGA
jgi:hypothetical protein